MPLHRGPLIRSFYLPRLLIIYSEFSVDLALLSLLY